MGAGPHVVAVRAIVPVTQKPPNKAEATLATPWPTSSQFERWRPPVMPSATTAESRDSIEPRSANATALGSTDWIFSRLKSGSAGAGSRFGIPPKREPMVATGRSKIPVKAAAATTVINTPGQ